LDSHSAARWYAVRQAETSQRRTDQDEDSKQKTADPKARRTPKHVCSKQNMTQ
jgi:hypothetical protein